MSTPGHARHPETGGVILIRRGEPGYQPVDTQLRADVLNALLDPVPTPLQIEAMLIGSMFGWDVPGANPELRRGGADGRAFGGRCTIVEHQHFLICADPQNLLGRVEDPIEDLDLAGVEVLQNRS